MPADPTPAAPPPSNEQLEAWVAAASPDDLTRALRIVLGAEQASWERNLTSGAIWFSPSFFRALGLPAVHDRDAVNARMHPDDRPHFERIYAQALHEGGTFGYDVRFLDHAGHYRWMRAVVRVWLAADGRAERLIGVLNDVHAEKAAQLEALENAARYRRALDASGEAHIERTAGLDDFFVSDNLAVLLGHPPGTPSPDVDGFMAWVHDDDRPALLAVVKRAALELGPWQATYRLCTHGGQWRWFRGRGRSELDEHGRIRMSGMVGDVHQQVLDRHELERHRHHLSQLVAERTERLDAALAEAERARRAQSEFLAHMSHELRTPLHGLIGLTTLALDVAALPAQRRYLGVALESGRTLLQLIETLLDFSRIDSGRLDLAERPFDLPELLAQSLRSLAPDIGEVPLSLRYDWVGEGSHVVRGDEARVHQVVSNLLANAIKFTARGHVSLRAGWVGVDGGGAPLMSVQIEDSGPGIAIDRQQAVFDAFVQGDASLKRAHGGVGLGLAIARRLARAMGGDVQLLHSGPQGSCFEFRWPARAEPGAQDEPASALASGSAWLVNRSRPSNDWMAARVQRLGWRVSLFDSPAEALARARTSVPADQPELLMMGQNSLGDGSALAGLRAALPRARLALIVRPVWRQPAVEAQAQSLAVETVVMPLSPRDLHELLQPAAAPPPIGAEPRPLTGARVLLVEDNPVNSMIGEEFLRQLGLQPQCASHGGQALEACLAQPPALVLMDLQMPVMDGLEATQRLRTMQADGRLPRFPIIALSAHAGDSDRRDALAAGVDGYLTKPILLDDLRSALARFMPELK